MKLVYSNPDSFSLKRTSAVEQWSFHLIDPFYPSQITESPTNANTSVEILDVLVAKLEFKILKLTA